MSRWQGLAILMVLAFLNYMDRNRVYPLLALISKDLGIPVDQLGALATGFHVVYACSAPLVGALSDRFARKTVLLIALVTWSVITALSGTAQGFISLLIWRSLTGLGEGGYFPTAVSLIGDMFRQSQRGLAIALHGVCTTLGGSAGYAVGGYLGERSGWRLPFFLGVIPGLALRSCSTAGSSSRSAARRSPPTRTRCRERSRPAAPRAAATTRSSSRRRSCSSPSPRAWAASP